MPRNIAVIADSIFVWQWLPRLGLSLFDRMAIGVAFNSVRMDLDVNKENINGNLDWDYDGGLIFLKFDF